MLPPEACFCFFLSATACVLLTLSCARCKERLLGWLVANCQNRWRSLPFACSPRCCCWGGRHAEGRHLMLLRDPAMPLPCIATTSLLHSQAVLGRWVGPAGARHQRQSSCCSTGGSGSKGLVLRVPVLEFDLPTRAGPWCKQCSRVAQWRQNRLVEALRLCARPDSLDPKWLWTRVRFLRVTCSARGLLRLPVCCVGAVSPDNACQGAFGRSAVLHPWKARESPSRQLSAEPRLGLVGELMRHLMTL
jgi:hypothetical protein